MLDRLTDEATLKVAGLIVAILAALAALLNALAALYNAWRENRWLKIRIEPKEWNHSPAAGGHRRVAFVLTLSAFNPANGGNALTGVKAWVDRRESECHLILDSAEGSTNVKPFEYFAGRIAVEAFKNLDGDPSAAYTSVQRIRVKVKVARGFHLGRRTFKRSEFPPSDGR